jgi:hypothetical protein
MKCQLIQTAKIGDENRAEQEMLAFLSNLPGEFFVYRELQVTPAYRERVKGIEKKQPDFVVVSPATGLVSIEVKDWNLIDNIYSWRDQYKIEVTRRDTGRVDLIENPAAQVEAYQFAFIELLKGIDAFVTSILAFPRASRADFLNRLQDIEVLRNPQSKFYVDLNKTLFREDLDAHVSCPERLLLQVAKQDPRFRPASPQQAERVHRRLLPSSFRIGDYTKRQENSRQLKTITEQQQRWIFSLDRRQNYLLDVAGSGKTNALISKAIHIVDQAHRDSLPRILLTTYSHNLETNIRRIFHHKIADASDPARYTSAIAIQCIPAILEAIVLDAYGLTDIGEYRAAVESPADYESKLRGEIEDILKSEPDRFRRFDYAFIDEIQDFDNFFLQVVAHLCKTKDFFFVGDIGQKIYERSYDLNRLGLVAQRIGLDKSYKMFRTPRFIAELATRFILRDPLSKEEFKVNGYTEDFKFPNKLPNSAEILRSAQPEAEMADRVRSLLNATYSEEDMMVIASETRLPRVEAALKAAGVRCVRGEPQQGSAISLVDFINVKGLEKEVVFVIGIEDLYERSKAQGMFDDEDSKARQERYSRRKVYVSLTRPLEQLVIYYQDPSNRFVSELLAINKEILSHRQGGPHAV